MNLFNPPGNLCDKILPPKVAGFDHTERVLVYYEANPEADLTDTWGIAYYHYDPPFDSPRWLDFQHLDRTPSLWWPLPKPVFESDFIAKHSLRGAP